MPLFVLWITVLLAFACTESAPSMGGHLHLVSQWMYSCSEAFSSAEGITVIYSSGGFWIPTSETTVTTPLHSL